MSTIPLGDIPPRVWHIVSEVSWTLNDGLLVDREPRQAITKCAYATSTDAMNAARTMVFTIAEEPGIGTPWGVWCMIDKPYHVIVRGAAYEQLGQYADLDVAEMAMRLWMSGH